MTEEVITVMCVTFSYSDCSDVTGFSWNGFAAAATLVCLTGLLNWLILVKLLTRF